MEEELRGNHPLWLLFGSFGRKEICCHEGNSITATPLTSKSKKFIPLSILHLFQGLQLGGGGFLTEALQVAIGLSYLSFFVALQLLPCDFSFFDGFLFWRL